MSFPQALPNKKTPSTGLNAIRKGGGKPGKGDTVPTLIRPGLGALGTRTVEPMPGDQKALTTPGEVILDKDASQLLNAMVAEFMQSGTVDGKPPTPSELALIQSVAAQGGKGFAQGGAVQPMLTPEMERFNRLAAQGPSMSADRRPENERPYQPETEVQNPGAWRHLDRTVAGVKDYDPEGAFCKGGAVGFDGGGRVSGPSRIADSQRFHDQAMALIPGPSHPFAQPAPTEPERPRVSGDARAADSERFRQQNLRNFPGAVPGYSDGGAVGFAEGGKPDPWKQSYLDRPNALPETTSHNANNPGIKPVSAGVFQGNPDPQYANTQAMADAAKKFVVGRNLSDNTPIGISMYDREKPQQALYDPNIPMPAKNPIPLAQSAKPTPAPAPAGLGSVAPALPDKTANAGITLSWPTQQSNPDGKGGAPLDQVRQAGSKTYNIDPATGAVNENLGQLIPTNGGTPAPGGLTYSGVQNGLNAINNLQGDTFLGKQSPATAAAKLALYNGMTGQGGGGQGYAMPAAPALPDSPSNWELDTARVNAERSGRNSPTRMAYEDLLRRKAAAEGIQGQSALAGQKGGMEMAAEQMKLNASSSAAQAQNAIEQAKLGLEQQKITGGVDEQALRQIKARAVLDDPVAKRQLKEYTMAGTADQYGALQNPMTGQGFVWNKETGQSPQQPKTFDEASAIAEKMMPKKWMESSGDTQKRNALVMQIMGLAGQGNLTRQQAITASIANAKEALAKDVPMDAVLKELNKTYPDITAQHLK